MPDGALPIPARTDPARLAALIRGGAPFLALLGAPDSDAVVDAAADALAGEPVAFVRVVNPLRLPMSLERLVFQLTDGDPAVRGSPAERVRQALLNRSAGRKLVLVVAEAETLALPALLFLQGMPGAGAPPVQVVFTGAPQFRALLADERLRTLRDGLDAPPPLAVRRTRRLLLAGIVAVVAAGAVLAAAVSGWQPDTPARMAAVDTPAPAVPAPAPAAPLAVAPTTPSSDVPPAAPSDGPLQPAPAPDASAPDTAAEPSPAAPSPAAPSPAAPPQAAAPPAAAPVPESPEEARTRLYREFTAFLQDRGMARHLSRSDRQALFEEYLAHHRVTSAVPQSDLPDLPRIAAELHVVLMVPPGSAPGRKLAERETSLLRDKATDVATRIASSSIAAPTIRYFFPDDRAAALSLARDLPAPGGEWRVEDMTTQPTRPGPGTVEIWLPR